MSAFLITYVFETEELETSVEQFADEIKEEVQQTHLTENEHFELVVVGKIQGKIHT